MLNGVKLKAEELFMVKKGFSFYILYDLKI